MIRLIKPLDVPASLLMMNTSSLVPTKMVPIAGGVASSGTNSSC